MQNEMINPRKPLNEIIEYCVQQGYIDVQPNEVPSAQLIANKLITTLMYKSKRHHWDDHHCQSIRDHIAMLELDDLPQGGVDDYDRYLKFQEQNCKTYFSSYLSDNSDSDEEAEFPKKPVAERNAIANDARKYRIRAELDNIRYANNRGGHMKGSLKANGQQASELFNLKERQTIHYGRDVDPYKVAGDLMKLNQLIAQGKSIKDALSELQAEAKEKNETFTSFYVAQYRGVAHVNTKWNKQNRKDHRSDKDEVNEPQYSSSVLESLGLNLFGNYAETKRMQREDKARIENQANLLKEVLLTMREVKPYQYGNYTYRNLAYVLQNIYTQDYHGFLKLLNTDPWLKTILFNGAIPFVSMGDNPYHAAKYAYGMKPYAGHEGDILQPNWHSDGRAERPYSGVVYVSLHPISDFDVDGPLHLITLNRNAEIKLNNELVIIAEHESCFPSYLPEGRVIHKHIAKYPSLKAQAKEITFHKYGLSKDECDKFRQALLVDNKPHTEGYKRAKALLGEALCSYQEVRLIDIARKAAEERKGVLIYRDVGGKFSLRMPYDSINQNLRGVNPDDKRRVKAKQAKRAAIANRQSVIQELCDPVAVKKFFESLDPALEVMDPPKVLMDDVILSLPASLMLNAIVNQRYLALEYFLSIPMFQNTVNETFNTKTLIGATLLHVAVGKDDLKAVKLILSASRDSIGIKAKLVSDEPVELMLTPASYALHRDLIDLYHEADFDVEDLLVEINGLKM